MANDRPPWERDEPYPEAPREVLPSAKAFRKQSALALTRAQSARRGKAIEQAVRELDRIVEAGSPDTWDDCRKLAAKLRKAIGMKANG